MKSCRKILLCGLVTLLISDLFGSETNFEFNQLSWEQRLPGESVLHVFQDSKAVMWFAIESFGLCKYNGREFSYPDISRTSSLLTLKFSVTSPFWKKPLFILLVTLLVFFITLLIYQARLRFLKRYKLKLKFLVEEKTRNLMGLNQELKEHKAHLEEMVDLKTIDLERARKKAEEAVKLKMALLANMSHEIRTPLNAIIGLTNMLMEKISDDPQNKGLGNMIESNARSLQQLIDDIIDISKIEANQLNIQKDAFAVNECIKNLAEVYIKKSEFFKEIMDIEIIADYPEEETYIISDQFRIEQVMKNLINNSLKFTRTGHIKFGYQLISNDEGAEAIRFFVKDTGVGISPENIHKIFERFEKDEPKDNIMRGGTGLGLSISYNLVKLLGGNIWVESEPDKGSQFYFEIPNEKPEEINLDELVSAPVRDYRYNWKDKHVLIAEDMEINFIVLEGILEKTGIKITHVKDGLPAVEAIERDIGKDIDIVLLDVRMKNMDGIEALKKIKEINKNLPVIAQTALALGYEENEIIKSGFDDYIAKPLKSSELFEKMARFLE